MISSHQKNGSIPEPAVKSVRAFSTGSGEQHKEHRYGTRLPKMLWALTSRSWIEVPINVFVIEHRDYLVLFDTGLDPAISADPDYISSPVGRYFLRKVFRFHIGPNDTVVKNLGDLGYSPNDVRKIVFSHLHFDHIGGIRDFPQAELVVSRDEWQQMSMPYPERDWILREHIELPRTKWRPIDFIPTDDRLLAPFGASYDLMGDGSMVLLPTPGHTPGSMSMLIRCDDRPPLLLVGDLTYETELLIKDQIPGVYSDRTQLKSSFANVRGLKQQLPDLTILASHDPDAIDTLKLAYSDAQ